MNLKITSDGGNVKTIIATQLKTSYNLIGLVSFLEGIIYNEKLKIKDIKRIISELRYDYDSLMIYYGINGATPKGEVIGRHLLKMIYEMFHNITPGAKQETILNYYKDHFWTDHITVCYNGNRLYLEGLLELISFYGYNDLANEVREFQINYQHLFIQRLLDENDTSDLTSNDLSWINKFLTSFAETIENIETNEKEA